MDPKLISRVMKELSKRGASKGGKALAAKSTPEERKARAIHAVRAREAQRAAKRAIAPKAASAPKQPRGRPRKKV